MLLIAPSAHAQTVVAKPAGVTAKIAISNTWNTGYCANLSVTNTTTLAQTWSVAITLTGKVSSLWNGTWSQTGAVVNVAGVAWNSVLNPQQTDSSVGFCVDGTVATASSANAVSSVKMNSSSLASVVALSSMPRSSAVASLTVSSRPASVPAASSRPASSRAASSRPASSRAASSTSVATNFSANIFLVGDSTVTNYKASVYPQAGWGQVLQHYFDAKKITILNRAIGGRSSRSFYQEGRWTTVTTEFKSGDYVFIQFGHNDRDSSNATRYTPPADFKSYLRLYINEARNFGVKPVLVSPMVMNAYRSGVLRNVFTETGTDYRGAMLQVATELSVPFVDLNMKSFNLVKSVGQDYASHYFYLILNAGEYPNFPSGSADGTHFQEMGAVEMARLVVEGLTDNKALADIAPLVSSLKPTYALKVKSSVNAAGTITRANSYPEGTPLTLKAMVTGSNTFTQWLLAGRSVSSQAIYLTPMAANGLDMTAVFNGVTPAN